jgi:hypothetical protein
MKANARILHGRFPRRPVHRHSYKRRRRSRRTDEREDAAVKRTRAAVRIFLLTKLLFGDAPFSS